MTPLVALAPSPLLGPAVWQPVADLLSTAGWDTTVVAAPPRVGSATDVLDAVAGGLPRDRELVLVLHSNAGLYAAALAQRLSVRAVVFVDAGLPAPMGPTPVAPPGLLDLLRQKADDRGTLPPWTAWWDEADVAPLFPDAAVRARVEAEQRRLPLAYFLSAVPAASLDVPWAYLAFGETYADEAGRATAEQRRLIVLAGRHLHMLVAPQQVAGALEVLLRHLGCEPAGS